MISLDASTFLAYIFGEEGGEIVEQKIHDGWVISCVNLTEVILKLQRHNRHDVNVFTYTAAAHIAIIPYTKSEMDALLDLNLSARSGLSLADRICLSTAAALKCPVYTADHSWKSAAPHVEVRLIR